MKLILISKFNIQTDFYLIILIQIHQIEIKVNMIVAYYS